MAEHVALGQAVGALVDSVEKILDHLVEKKILEPADRLIHSFRDAVTQLRQAGLRMEPPDDPGEVADKVRCPRCRAMLRAKAGKKVQRCDWCGHVF